MIEKERSPFTPGSPVSPELFVGRKVQIEEILRYVRQSGTGALENIFLSGVRGIGKSSLASFLRQLAVNQMAFVGLHVHLGGVTTLEELVRRILDRLLNEGRGKPWYKKVSAFFGEHVKQVGLFGVSISFSPPSAELEEVVRNFPQALKTVVGSLPEEHKGLLIILDDINGLAQSAQFANWYKSFADEVATSYPDFPVTMVLTGLPEQRDELARLQPSLMRIFRVAEISKLRDEDVQGFFRQAFSQTGIEVQEDALRLLVPFSGGFPLLMHEIGDAIFWADEDGVVDAGVALAGIIGAAINVGKKYLDPKVYRAIQSPRYRTILRKLGKMSPFITGSFVKKDLEAKLSDSEKKVFHNFLRKMRDLGVIEHDLERGPGAYKFVNEIYPLYISMESRREAQAS